MDMFYAKGNKETIEEHTYKVLEQLNRVIDLYKANIKYHELMRLAVKYHDAGKVMLSFQKKLNNEHFKNVEFIKHKDYIKHNHLSSYFVLNEEVKDLDYDELRMLYQIIYYHHQQKNSIFIKNLDGVGEIIDYISENILPNYDFNYNVEEYILDRIDFFNEDDEQLVYNYYVSRGIVKRADWMGSANLNIETDKLDKVESVNNFMSKKKFSLNKMQKFMFNNTNNNIITIASTGMGKTEGSLLWIGDSKGLFTLPLKVSLNSLYKRSISEDILNLDKYKVGLVHSDTSFIVDDKEEIPNMKNFNKNLTFCTIDQLLPIVFKHKHFDVKLGILSHSKVVLDEVQAYNPTMLGYIVVFLKMVVAAGGQFAIVTATLPPVFKYYLEKELKQEVLTESFIHEDKNNHVVTCYDKYLEVDDIIKNYNNNKVLVVVNTVRKAKKLYEELTQRGIEANLLHSHFTVKDRKIKETDIQSQFNYGIWISTQIVEASLDIDFDILLTELSEISGLVQRMGRIYRHRKYTSDKSNILVYTKTDSIGPTKNIVDYTIYKLTKEAIQSYKDYLLTEYEKQELVKYIYSVENLKKHNSEYLQEIRNTINNIRLLNESDIKAKDIKVRELDTVTIIPRILGTEYNRENTIVIRRDILNKLLKTKEISYDSTNNCYFMDVKYDFEHGLYLD
ncbi:CRISPR-associated helicase/endonuclease Cas3 [Paraclostridium sordellii]|uniref:CRISPR-associated helicase/endonuclease Cas3 n=2 Tax=Paraclostridium sordellii TaxID=1505 RepID=UPI0005EA1FF7|nr:CRISPR-associated helicase [[Clostridium] sordellii] [Paeniclostridium sordellii]